ncbi:hypothetical protein WMF20_04840 [Sorangium sp. So ce834]|uniref:hypothetical protein n=1 Tax=Sorangium sp. So ce834 TaxID=3133321 RepID=UPI003F5FFF97
MSYANPSYPILSFLYALYSNDTAEKKKIRDNPRRAYREYHLSMQMADICNKTGREPGAKPTAGLADQIVALMRNELIAPPKGLMYDPRYANLQFPLLSLLYAVFADSAASPSRRPLDNKALAYFPNTGATVAALLEAGEGNALSPERLNTTLSALKTELLSPVYSPW